MSNKIKDEIAKIDKLLSDDDKAQQEFLKMIPDSLKEDVQKVFDEETTEPELKAFMKKVLGK